MKEGEKGEKKSLKDSVSMSGGLDICSMQLHLFLNISSVHKWGKSCQVNQKHSLAKKNWPLEEV